MAVTEPALIVAQKLHGVGGLVLGNGATPTANLFAGMVKPADPASGVPEAAVFVRASGGAAPEPYFVGPSGAKTSWWRPSVQVVVRGNKDAEDTARQLASTIRTTLHRTTLTGYMSCLVRESAPVEVGNDDDGHPLFTLNVELWYKE